LGTLNHGPNLEGLLLFLNALQARQLDDIKVRIVGGPSKEGAALQKDFSFVDYLGALPESELQSETGRWTCFIHPIFCYPRGCSTKLATAISWQIPIVTTHAGCRGYQWRAGSLCLADEPDVFVEMALNLLKKENAINAQKEVKSVCESSPTLQEVGQKICACLRPIIGSN
jgi:hypothetical protein